MHMWFDTVAPTADNTDCFTKSTDTMSRLKKNHDLLSDYAQRHSKELFSDVFITAKLRKQFQQNDISDTFFYDIEKAQLFSVVKMTMNYCLLFGDCAAGDAPQQLTRYAFSNTAKGRAKQRDRNSVKQADLLAATVFGAVGLLYVSGLNEMLNTAQSGAETYATPTNSRCEAGDRCYEVLEQKPAKLSVRCTKGSLVGSKPSVCANAAGKWATGCGFSDAFAHHDNSAHDAANKACGLGSWW